MQLQSSLCRKIPFCVICGSQSSVEEDSTLLVYINLAGWKKVYDVSVQRAAHI
jgi:hypothetical protein